MNSHKIENVLKMSKEDKYSYFISKVSDFEEVWGLYNEGWAVLGNNEKEDILPFWPEREFAIIAADELWKDYSPKSIDLSDFIEKYLVGMCSDGIKANVFYNSIDNGVVVNPLRLKEDIELEMVQYI